MPGCQDIVEHVLEYILVCFEVLQYVIKYQQPELISELPLVLGMFISFMSIHLAHLCH